MSLSHHQQNIVDFFSQHLDDFIEFLFTKQNEKIVVISNIHEDVIAFLDYQLRQEIKIYSYQSQGYNRILDMLIEIHIIAKDSETMECVSDRLSKFYLQTSAE